MKKVKCGEMGGPVTGCDEVFTAETSQEMIDQAWKHMQVAHPEAVKDIMSNPKEVNDKWMADFHANFSSLQDA